MDTPWEPEYPPPPYSMVSDDAIDPVLRNQPLDRAPPTGEPIEIESDTSRRSSIDSLEAGEIGVFGHTLPILSATSRNSSAVPPAPAPAPAPAPTPATATEPIPAPVTPRPSSSPAKRRTTTSARATSSSTAAPPVPTSTAYPISLYLSVHPPPLRPGAQKRGRPGKPKDDLFGPIDDITTALPYHEVMFMLAREGETLPSLMDKKHMEWGPLKPANAARLPFHDLRGWEKGVVPAAVDLATQKKPVVAKIVIYMNSAQKPSSQLWETMFNAEYEAVLRAITQSSIAEQGSSSSTSGTRASTPFASSSSSTSTPLAPTATSALRVSRQSVPITPIGKVWENMTGLPDPGLDSNDFSDDDEPAPKKPRRFDEGVSDRREEIKERWFDKCEDHPGTICFPNRVSGVHTDVDESRLTVWASWMVNAKATLTAPPLQSNIWTRPAGQTRPSATPAVPAPVPSAPISVQPPAMNPYANPYGAYGGVPGMPMMPPMMMPFPMYGGNFGGGIGNAGAVPGSSGNAGSSSHATPSRESFSSPPPPPGNDMDLDTFCKRYGLKSSIKVALEKLDFEIDDNLAVLSEAQMQEAGLLALARDRVRRAQSKYKRDVREGRI